MTVQQRSRRQQRSDQPERPHTSVPADRPCRGCGEQVQPYLWLHVGAWCLDCDYIN